MSQITRVDIPIGLGAADDIEAWGDKLADALASLKREATELEGCWGDDKFAVKFAKSYLPFGEQTLNNAHPRAPAGPAAWGPSWNSSRARS
ncbi:MAG: hypothetical protein QOE61_2096 [Micromonosporaceae bacterium]|jgi:hypothetical protein|nr:hypothetical protein [Micromonosporaceae bacterium]